jgi:hypothetical protein
LFGATAARAQIDQADPRARPRNGGRCSAGRILGDTLGLALGGAGDGGIEIRLLEITEIGIATADPTGTRAAIQAALAADVLWGGRPGWRLTAIGDDHGVVIVAPTARGWIPVGLPAQPQPTTIVAEAPRPCDRTLSEGPYRIRTVS